MDLKALILRYFRYCFWTKIRSEIYFFNLTSFRLKFTSSWANRFIQGAFYIEIGWTFQICLPPRAMMHMRAPKMPSLYCVWVKKGAFYRFWRFFNKLDSQQVLTSRSTSVDFWKVHLICDRSIFYIDTISQKLTNLRACEVESPILEKKDLKALILRYFPYCFWTKFQSEIYFFNPTSFRLKFTSSWAIRFIQGAFYIEIDWTFQICLPPRAMMHMRAPKMPSLYCV